MAPSRQSNIEAPQGLRVAIEHALSHWSDARFAPRTRSEFVSIALAHGVETLGRDSTPSVPWRFLKEDHRGVAREVSLLQQARPANADPIDVGNGQVKSGQFHFRIHPGLIKAAKGTAKRNGVLYREFVCHMCASVLAVSYTHLTLPTTPSV